MPYISKDLRQFLDEGDEPMTCGGLNYAITKMCKSYAEGQGYQGINDVVGALECAKLEFYRRLASPYEDKKILENGDVY